MTEANYKKSKDSLTFYDKRAYKHTMSEKNLHFYSLVSLWGEEKGVKIPWENISHKTFLNKSLTKIYLCKLWFL